MMEEDLELTFWEHLDVLRGTLIRIIAVALICGIAAFMFKEELFNIVLAPKDSQFVTYRLLGVEPFNIQLVNIGLTEQFMICLLYTSPSPRDLSTSRMPSSA